MLRLQMRHSCGFRGTQFGAGMRPRLTNVLHLPHGREDANGAAMRLLNPKPFTTTWHAALLINIVLAISYLTIIPATIRNTAR